MAAIERLEIRMVNLASKTNRVDAIQSFVSQERRLYASSMPTAQPAWATAIRSARAVPRSSNSSPARWPQR